MHIRGWIILAVSIFFLLLILLELVYVARTVRKIHKRVAGLDLSSDKSAMAEAKSAHQRIDRIDSDLTSDHIEVGFLRQMISTIKSQVQFIMHRDISAEISRQADADKEIKK